MQVIEGSTKFDLLLKLKWGSKDLEFNAEVKILKESSIPPGGKKIRTKFGNHHNMFNIDSCKLIQT